MPSFQRFLYRHCTYYLYSEEDECFLCSDGQIRPDSYSGVHNVHLAVFNNREEVDKVLYNYEWKRQKESSNLYRWSL